MKFISHHQWVAIRKLIFLIIVSITVYGFYKINAIKRPLFSTEETNEIEWNSYLLEEINFPLAYGISVYRDCEQFQRLFNAIYRPFNVYCIHVDAKSDKKLYEYVINLSKKYQNVILPKKFIDVVHSTFSVLESELLCMEALLNYEKIKWKYFINLTGQEWPLKVNLELVRILKALNGSNLLEKIKINPERVPKSVGLPPHDIQLWKGSVHIIVVKRFVEFALQDKRALDLLEFLRKTDIPDETYFSTLNHDHSLRAPGGYSGDLLRNPDKYPFLNRHKLWKGEDVCYGKFVRGICIFSLSDIPKMIDVNNKKLFANKFIMGVNTNVYDFMENWFYKRNKVVYSNTKVNPFINLTYYSTLTVVANHYD